MLKKKVMIVFGTRPEGIKMAPVVRAFQSSEDFETIVVNTAQHREMLDQVLAFFKITPQYDLNIMKQNQTLEGVSNEILNGLIPIIDKEKPDLLIVHGDTTTTFMAAYCAFLRQVPVAHVEAGLRTYDIYSPYPEEMNRQLVGRVATYHLAATERNKEQLISEQVSKANIAVVGNSTIDALFYTVEQDVQIDQELEKVISKGSRIILVTTHRRENLEGLQEIYNALNQMLDDFSDIEIVFPVHKNPKVRKKVEAFLKNDPRVHLVEPLDYAPFAHIMKHAYLILTDSGGIQEEAPALDIPVLVARNTTERQEGIDAGTLKLVGTESQKIYEDAYRLLTDEMVYQKMAHSTNPYGDGKTAGRIVDFIRQKLK